MLETVENKSTPSSCILERNMVEYTTMQNFTILEGGSARGSGKRRRAKLISADVWGSSAYYPADVLERDAAQAFVAGTKMYENHLSDSELYERPGGDVSKMIGKLITNGTYEPDGEEGPGVYADVEFYDSYVDRINEIGEDVGLSVYGSADYVEGEREGRYGRIVTRIVSVQSVDVVTKAGAGGKLVSIIESARSQAGTPIKTEGEQSMAELTKEDFSAGIDQLSKSFTEAIAAVTEAVASRPEEPAPIPAPAGQVESTAGEVEETETDSEITIDHAAVITSIAEAALPVEVVENVIAELKNGVELTAAIEKQTKLKEAFNAAAAPTHLRIKESTDGETSLSSQILGIFK